MQQTRFTEEQSIRILREHKAGAKTADLVRKHGISSAAFYASKAKFGGQEVLRSTSIIENFKWRGWLQNPTLSVRSFLSQNTHHSRAGELVHPPFHFK